MPSGKAVQLYDFDFFFKTDDDATLCIAQLVKDLRAAPKGASVYAGRRVKAGRALEAGKPLEVNLGLTTDPPHFGGHGYGVSYDVACGNLGAPRHRRDAAPRNPPWRPSARWRGGSLYHHLHEDTCFGNWVVGFDVKRLNLRAMTDHYYPNQKNLAGVSRLCGNHAIVQTHLRRRRRVDGVETSVTLHAIVQTHFHTQVSAERKRACARIMAQRYANGSAWDLYGSGCGFKQLPRSVPVEKCVRVASAAAAAAPRARPAPVMTPASPSVRASPSL